MGVVNHECLIAVLSYSADNDLKSCFTDWINKNAKDDFNDLSSLFIVNDCIVNGYTTIAFLPSGSHEGFNVKIFEKEIRRKFIAFIESLKYDDGSSPVSYVELCFGEYGHHVLSGNNENVF